MSAELAIKSICLWKRLTWALRLDHVCQIPLMDKENQTSSCKEQDEPQRTRHSPSAYTEGVAQHPQLYPQHDVVQPDVDMMSSVENKNKK